MSFVCTDDDNRSYRNVCNLSFVSFSLAVIFIINSHKPHGPQGGDHCFKALSKYCKWLVSPICFEIFRFLGVSAYPKLTFDSTLYQLAGQV